MVEMTETEKKKEYLLGYICAKKQLERLNEELTEIRINKMFPSYISDGMPHSNNKSDLSSYAVKIEEMEKKILKARYKRLSKLKEIKDKIERVKDENEKSVLFYRYIKDMTWEEISVKMHYSYRNITKIHGRALLNFQI